MNNSASLYSATADINLPEFQDRITDPTDPNGDDDDPGLLTPYIIVRNYTYNSSVTPGNDLTVTANMYNESGDVILRNIYLEISGSEGVVPKSATNSILIKELGTGNHTSIKMTFQTPDELSAQSVQITYSFTFQYLHEGKYQDGKATQVVNIPIRQGEKEEEENEDRFSISMVDVPTELYIGQEGYLTVTVINKGKKQVSNVSAIIVSDNLTNSNYTEYYGAVLANTKAEIELPILANEAGQFSGTVIVEYEDADDNLKTLEKEITMNWMDMGGGIVDPWPWPEPEPEPEPEPSGMPWWAWVAIGVGVIVVIVVISKLVKRRREKQLEVEDEDF